MSVIKADKPKELPKRLQGTERCEDFGQTKLCVRAGKYGFSGEWVSDRTGMKLPLITHHAPRDRNKPVVPARSFNQAFKNARAFIKRTRKNQSR